MQAVVCTQLNLNMGMDGLQKTKLLLKTLDSPFDLPHLLHHVPTWDAKKQYMTQVLHIPAPVIALILKRHLTRFDK